MSQRRIRLATVGAFFVTSVLVSGTATAATPPPGGVLRVSVATGGGQGSGHSFWGTINGSGTKLAFSSSSKFDGAPFAEYNIFHRDRTSGVTRLVTRGWDGGVVNHSNHEVPAISRSGAIVTYNSYASNLVRGDTNGSHDVFEWTAATRANERVSVSTAGRQGNGASNGPAPSTKGRFIAFASDANNLVTRDLNGTADVFVRDRLNRTTTRVSVDSSEREGHYYPYGVSISGDGRFVAFASHPGLATFPPGPAPDARVGIYLRDRLTGVTRQVSAAHPVTTSGGTKLSEDGRILAFITAANGVVADDKNNRTDVYLYDSERRALRWVSRDFTSADPLLQIDDLDVSGDGRFVAYTSAPGLVNPTEGDVYLFDRSSGSTDRLTAEGRSLNGTDIALSRSGALLAFATATALVPADENGSADVYLYRHR